MSAQQKLEERRNEILGLEKTLEKLLAVLIETKARHAEELATSEEEINKITLRIRAQKDAIEIAEELNKEHEKLNQEREEDRREEIKYFLVLRNAIAAGTATVDDCDTYALEMGYELNEEAEEESPPLLDQTA